MDAIAVVLIGVGAYLMYAAFKKNLTPVTQAKTSLAKVSGSSSGTG